MAEVTVTQFAEVLRIPVDKLLAQLGQAGISVSGPADKISDAFPPPPGAAAALPPLSTAAVSEEAKSGESL